MARLVITERLKLFVTGLPGKAILKRIHWVEWISLSLPREYCLALLLRQWIPNNGGGDNVWHMKPRGIQTMLQSLEQQTGIKCNAHSFRRGFACNLHRKGLSTLDIMHLGGWEDLSMVLRYTRSITFEDYLQHYREALVCSSSIKREY